MMLDHLLRVMFGRDGAFVLCPGNCISTTSSIGKTTILTTKRKPATAGEILVEEFMRPMGLTQAALAEAMGVQRKHANELCQRRRGVTAATALILARVFGNSAEFWPISG